MFQNLSAIVSVRSSAHSQKKQFTPLYIFISASYELSLYSWMAGLNDNMQWSELFLLTVHCKCNTKSLSPMSPEAHRPGLQRQKFDVKPTLLFWSRGNACTTTFQDSLDQCPMPIGIDWHWDQCHDFDRHWSALISMSINSDLHWEAFRINAMIYIGIDRHLAMIEGVLYMYTFVWCIYSRVWSVWISRCYIWLDVH